MFLELDLNSEIPIYIQIKDQIIHLIAKGELKEGDKLPSVRQLAIDIGVNLHTINKAYNLLKDGGFLVVNRRMGVLVNSNDSYAFDSDYMALLELSLKPIITEAVARNVSEKQIMSLIEQLTASLKGSEHHE